MPNYEVEDEELPPTDPIPPTAPHVGSSSGARRQHNKHEQTTRRIISFV